MHSNFILSIEITHSSLKPLSPLNFTYVGNHTVFQVITVKELIIGAWVKRSKMSRQCAAALETLHILKK